MGLQGALGRDGVRGEVGQAGTGAEDDDAVLLHVADGTQGDVGLGDLSHGDGGLDTGGHPGLLNEVLQGQGVHDGSQHAHVVGAGAVHAARGELGAAEEVPASDDDGDLDSGAHGLGDLAGGVGDDVGVQTYGSATEDLTGELE